MNFQQQPFAEREGSAIRHVLREELHAMHHPEIADLLQLARFSIAGRTLWIQLPPSLELSGYESTLNQAALRSGLRLDAARLYPERYETALQPQPSLD